MKKLFSMCAFVATLVLGVLTLASCDKTVPYANFEEVLDYIDSINKSL